MKKLALFFVLAGLAACSGGGKYEYQLNGYAQGSTYHITFLNDEESGNFQAEIDSIFDAVDRSVSTYHKNSLISRLNRGDTLQPDEILSEMLRQSDIVSQRTEGAFDPTVGPLVNFWGFGPEKLRTADSSRVDSVLKYTGFDALQLNRNPFYLPQGYQLDFNAIAQGYTVDLISWFLQNQGVENYLVEVGGEVRCLGENMQGQTWRIGVDKPTEKIDQQARFQFVLALDSAALATSGNYRKFWTDEETGTRYAHTLDPETGFPAKNRLLSTSVVAGNATTADAYATAFMVMGVDKALKFLQESDEKMEAYFIMSSPKDTTWEVYKTQGFDRMILNE